MAFELPPETQDRQVTITIPKEVDPYFKEWYLETRKEGETPESFAYRNLAKAGLAYHRQKLEQEQIVLVNAYADELKLAHDSIILDGNLE